MNVADRRVIIFTDLDGTLLHPETHSFHAALPALDVVRKKGIPLVLCSSKTRAELELYRRRLNIGEPFISENGGGLFVPADYFSFPPEGDLLNDTIMIIKGKPYSRIREVFVEGRRSTGARVVGFGDMAPDAVSRATGLPPDEAVLAMRREFSEPFLFENGEDARLLRIFAEKGLRWTRGRLYCLTGKHDKGSFIRVLKKCYEREHAKIITIGLGDGMNDVPLLGEVDHPVLVKKNDGSSEAGVALPGLITPDGIGPEGWNKAVMALLQDL